MGADESLGDTVIRVHYHVQFGDRISIRGEGQENLSWGWGLNADWISEKGEDVWVLSLPTSNSTKKGIVFKPLINDDVWAKGHNYIVNTGETVDIYPFFHSTKGYFFKAPFHSNATDISRILAIYLPPSYHENLFKKYPVIIFQDGHNLFDTEDSFCGVTWQVHEAIDNLACNGGIKECIVVGVYPNKREHEYLPTYSAEAKYGGGADEYLKMLMTELRPNIERTFRTLPSYGIAGSSYGGMLAYYAWLSRPNDFEVCGAFSPSFRWDNKMIFKYTEDNLKKRPATHKLYMDSGTIEKTLNITANEMADHIRKQGSLSEEQFLYISAEGHDHSEKSWAARTPKALAFAFSDPQRVPN